MHFCTASISLTRRIPLKSIAQLQSLSHIGYPWNLFLHSFGLCHTVGFTGCVQSYVWACFQAVACAFSSSCYCCLADRCLRNGPRKLGITSSYQLLQNNLLLCGLGVFVCVCVIVCVCVCTCVCACVCVSVCVCVFCVSNSECPNWHGLHGNVHICPCQCHVLKTNNRLNREWMYMTGHQMNLICC